MTRFLAIVVVALGMVLALPASARAGGGAKKPAPKAPTVETVHMTLSGLT